jgi:hypothetical protein
MRVLQRYLTHISGGPFLAMSPKTARGASPIPAYAEPQSTSPGIPHQDFEAIQQPRPLSLDDLPTEIIDIIAQYVRNTERRSSVSPISHTNRVFDCFCKERKQRIRHRSSKSFASGMRLLKRTRIWVGPLPASRRGTGKSYSMGIPTGSTLWRTVDAA